MNVLFITADQWRGDCLSAVGHPCIRTPRLDRLAADGVLFRRHYAQATPCGPSRASLHTGMYMQNHRSVINGTPLDARHTNIAIEARRAGYHPMLLGYTDTSADPRGRPPRDPQLADYGGVLPGMTPHLWVGDDFRPWRAELKSRGYDVPRDPMEIFRPVRARAPGEGATRAPARYRAEDSHSAYLTDEAIKLISIQDGPGWFVHLSYYAPHPPFVVPEPYDGMYDPAEVPRPVRASSPAEEGAVHPWLAHYMERQRGSALWIDHRATDNHRITERDLLQARATYYALASEVDTQLGRLFDYLRSIDAWDETVVVFTSDHGEQLGDHWLFAKYGYFDQAFHIPLIVRDPRPGADAGRGRRVDRFTENVDVMPTILDLLGADVPVQCDGESLVPFLRGEHPSGWRTEAHWEFDFRNFRGDDGGPMLGLKPDQCALNVLRGERYKYVHFTALPPLLFDLDRDPHELHDLTADPAYREEALACAQRMLSWRMNHDERVLANTVLTPEGVVEHRGPRR